VTRQALKLKEIMCFFNGKEDKDNQMGTGYFNTNVYYVTGYESRICL